MADRDDNKEKMGGGPEAVRLLCVAEHMQSEGKLWKQRFSGNLILKFIEE